MLLTIAIILLVALLVFGIYASANIRSGVYLSVLCKGDPAEKAVALTFDDGPDEIQTPKVLDVLSKYNVKATFFCIGNKAQQNPEIMHRIIEEGHLIGNHSFSHSSSFPMFCKVEMEADLRRTEDILSKMSGSVVSIFRPPFGVTNPTVAAVVQKLGYKTIGWSIRSFDTVKKLSRQQVLNRIALKLHNGGVILMHDDRADSDTLLDAVIQMIKSMGYQIKRADEILKYE